MLFFFSLNELLRKDTLEKKRYFLNPAIEKSSQWNVQGTVDFLEKKTKIQYIYLKNLRVWDKQSDTHYTLPHLVVVTSFSFNEPVFPGNQLSVNGKLQNLSEPSNPGQFDEKAYWKEKNIFYKMQADSLLVLNSKKNFLKCTLLWLKEQFQQVYNKCLPAKDAGIMTAMLLGEKSALDLSVRELYQKSGIGHLLAISGLHISILCMAFHSLCIKINLKKPLPFLFTTIFLTGYGIMTGFSIATSRAVLMMVLLLLAEELGKNYDTISAMCLSGIFILLQKPFAIFSCSFLLSYTAVLGSVICLPALKTIIIGDMEEHAKRRRRKKRTRTEKLKNSHFPKCTDICLAMQEKAFMMFLANIGIYLFTLPVMLYFFFEIPLYGILLNLFVLPFASIICILGALGAIAGLFFLPLAKIFLFPVSLLFSFYEMLCRCFSKLPFSTLILGRPSFWQITAYYAILLILIFFCDRIYRMEYKPFLYWKRLFILLLAGSVILLCRRPAINHLKLTFMDVSQGDAILIQNETGKVILIDGGSTDVSKVGTYRILPFLKYYGIRTIDYMIMTHEDEDHISGQQELLQLETGIRIRHLVLPDIADTSKGKNYYKQERLAIEKKIPISYLSQGQSLTLGKLSLTCLHPQKGFSTESSNAYSTTISLRYGMYSVLLTGDLEKEGEEAVTQYAQSHEADDNGYTILKVAHHGSKNATSDAFLKQMQPKYAVISCGRNNRYGHPHKELLNRLKKHHIPTDTTMECGAITIESDGKKLWHGFYKNNRKINSHSEIYSSEKEHDKSFVL